MNEQYEQIRGEIIALKSLSVDTKAKRAAWRERVNELESLLSKEGQET